MNSCPFGLDLGDYSRTARNPQMIRESNFCWQNMDASGTVALNTIPPHTFTWVSVLVSHRASD